MQRRTQGAMPSGARLDRVIQFRRFVEIDDGYSVTQDWQDYGSTVRAYRKDISDGEKAAGGGVFAELSARFQVRSSEFTRGIKPTDRLTEGGSEFQIAGIKELDRGNWLEITATVRVE